ncbi:hypothetical protein VP01_1563g1 [Puccinia sorghi]|uniref:DDE Tnp4 domain-containing protein n=1 Tax=Puccinia sorghi TaxID=27349 RepID=A0A0L6VHY3_9BASI|nr:hypothetical protein VP01_1563g1 [Puccinia sorghi]
MGTGTGDMNRTGDRKRTGQCRIISGYGNHYFDCKKRSGVIYFSLISNSETTLYSFPYPIVNKYSISCTLVCDVNKRFMLTSIQSQLIKVRITWPSEFQFQLSSCTVTSKEKNMQLMNITVKWIMSCVVLHNLLADLKDQFNEIFKKGGWVRDPH